MPTTTSSAVDEMRPFSQSLPHVLLRAREATMRFFRPLLSEHDLTEQQWRVLRALRHSEANNTEANNTEANNTESKGQSAPDVGELAARTFLLGPSLSRILNNLESRSLVKRTLDPGDHRRSWISLTDEGANVVARIAPSSEAQYAKIEEQLGDDALKELFVLLERLAEIEDPHVREQHQRRPAAERTQ